MSLEIKSTGTLIDEWVTADLKVKYLTNKDGSPRQQFLHRKNNLWDIIERRSMSIKKQGKLSSLIEKLYNINERCWNAQENILMFWYEERFVDCAESAVSAQQFNAKRNKIIREIDSFFNEDDFTQLEKSYA